MSGLVLKISEHFILTDQNKMIIKVLGTTVNKMPAEQWSPEPTWTNILGIDCFFTETFEFRVLKACRFLHSHLFCSFPLPPFFSCILSLSLSIALFLIPEFIVIKNWCFFQTCSPLKKRNNQLMPIDNAH
jgi:hypothetical protein